MKRLIIGYLAAGVAFCGLRWADLALWTDHASGLVTAGPVWARYAVLAVFAAAALVAGRAAAGSPAPLRTRQWAAAVPALAGTFLCVAGGILGLIQAAGVAAVASSILLLACGGYENNLEMQRDFHGMDEVYTAGTPGNTGDGFAMALRAGAGVTGMEYTQRTMLSRRSPRRRRKSGRSMLSARPMSTSATSPKRVIYTAISRFMDAE